MYAPIAAGLLAAFVGFAGSFAVVLQGLAAVGASPAQQASGLMALCVAKGLAGIVLSLRHRMPISAAWSTPGAALLVTTGAVEGGFAAATGAFLLTAVLLVLAGLWRPLGRWVSTIPPAIANAMLAGILLALCLAPAHAVAEAPVAGLLIVVAWAVTARIKRLLAVPVAVLVTVALIAATVSLPEGWAASAWPAPVATLPVLTVPAVIGIALPLFIVTMASQNIPGIAVLNVNGYRPAPGPVFTATGLFSLAAAPFGAHAVNLAAVTAALFAGPDAHPDPKRRWIAAVVGGAGYIMLGLSAGFAAAFVSAAPSVLIQAVAGLALLGSFASALLAALSDTEDREAATVTFLVAGSGLAFFGVGAAFWSLLAGLGLRELRRRRGALRAR
ncbi:benzoate/H(+) symporter BenE family transporter [Falsiroseomonas oryzae]|uniref:benzoate/H(+) symporter BenE family transporter n=1 Tax=Falsiroseomonas oryzae TaxID=2766473 RepID=UPI0022EA88A5|nr:benzoate/H(+) symporter BenE family transporter [Roseomonas sp. MO-31]